MPKFLTMYPKFMILIAALGCSSPLKVTKDPSLIKAPYNEGKFDNIEPFADKSFFDVLKWQLTFSREKRDWPDQIDQPLNRLKSQRSKDLKVTLIGHSTVLIQLDNLNILTDPQYSLRASPVSWTGPKRVVKPAIPFKELPPIDIVVVSHNHYDHLDLPTLKRLNDKFSPKIYVGLGNKYLLNQYEITNVIEMDWWDSLAFKGIKIDFVPVQHWSARGLFDKRETLWGGFVISGTKKVFFAGDTGYGKVFKTIGEKYQPIDLSLIPIGAYQPREFMKNAHVWPDESVKIMQDTGTRKAMGIHFGTFADLTDEYIDQPQKDLKAALDKRNMNSSDFIVPEFGLPYEFSY